MITNAQLSRLLELKPAAPDPATEGGLLLALCEPFQAVATVRGTRTLLTLYRARSGRAVDALGREWFSRAPGVWRHAHTVYHALK